MAHLYLPPPNGKKPPAWRSSPAKKMLRESIVAGHYPETIKEEIYGSSELFRQYKWENFKTNLGNLRKAIAQEQGRADEDAANLEADLAHVFLLDDLWPGLEAERLLKEDVDKGRHEGVKPLKLRATRPECQEWSLTSFCTHIQQELRG